MSVRWRLGCSTFAALVAFRSGSGNMSAAGLKLWLRAEEAGPDPCPNNLSAVMDLYNGEIIPYETARRPVFKLVSNMLDKALATLDDEDRPILHSGQGWQYQMPAWSRMLEGRNIANPCHARAIASTTPPWRASSPRSNPSSSIPISSAASKAERWRRGLYPL